MTKLERLINGLTWYNAIVKLKEILGLLNTGVSNAVTDLLIEVTKAEADTLIANETLQIGANYKISGVDVPLYGGTDIILTAVSNNKFSLEGTGIFYNPKYDNTVSGFNIWDSGNSYTAGDIAHWGGKSWTNLTGAAGSSVDVFTLDAVNWEEITYNDVDYNVAYDAIKYDYDRDVIVERNEKNCNIVSFSELGDDIFIKNPIKAFQWGNVPEDWYYVYNYYPYYAYLYNAPIGIVNNKIINSLNENINFRGYGQVGIRMNNLSFQINMTFGLGSSQSNITLDNGSYQEGITFGTNCLQEYVSLNNRSYQENLSFGDQCWQQHVVLDNQSRQFGLTFDSFGRQENIYMVNQSVQQTSTFDGAEQIDLYFNRGRQSNIQFTNGGQQTRLRFLNGGEQVSLTNAGGFDQNTCVFDGLAKGRTAEPITANETNIIWSTYNVTKPYTLAQLNTTGVGSIIPTKVVGMRAIMSDGNAETPLANANGGGSTMTVVTWNGTNWTVQ